MTDDSKAEATPPGDPAPVPDELPVTADPGEPRPPSTHTRPSEAATADIEERQDTQRAKERREGRPPEDAPSY